ncbi:hypothetical protein HPP92_024378 [Vanilla planifolia]|uniref:Uncharacterized protein n=1 Tax=Vanilla planifolia TaxID=51239 RepID=A0A835PMT1_VANPL|nr:hypothetical protein HPP92_024378 [Vanilla planifolia]
MKAFQLKQRIEEVIVAQASVHRCSAMVSFLNEEQPFFPVTVNDDTLCSLQEGCRRYPWFRQCQSSTPGDGSRGLRLLQRGDSKNILLFLRHAKRIKRALGQDSPYFTVNEQVLPFMQLCASLAIIPARGKHISWVFS